jgi:hypothetical protein
VETAEKMLTRQLSTAVRLQVAARGFLARRRLQKAHKQMRDREAALAVVAFAFDVEGCDLDSLDANCADPLMCPRVRMVSFPWMAYSNSAGAEVEEVSSSLSSTGTRCLAPQLSISDHREDVSAGLRRNCLQVVVPLHPSRSDGSMGSTWRMVPTVGESHKSLFHIKNNQIS